MSEPLAVESVRAALVRARERAEAHMVGAHEIGLPWGEKTVTELVLVAAHPEIQCADFSDKDERDTGADWLWWWVDDAGEAFGMLVQAKRLKGRHPSWVIDFWYRDGEQSNTLETTAELLRVPDIYVLYLGGVAAREGWSCGPAHGQDCGRCQRASVSYVPGLIVRDLGRSSGSRSELAAAAMHVAEPLEELIQPAGEQRPVHDMNLPQLDVELASFLLRGQAGARGVARSVLRLIATRRTRSHFLQADAISLPLEQDAAFRRVPRDRGHYGTAYYRHVLQGLRSTAPDYVTATLDGTPYVLPPDVADNVDGVAIVRIQGP